MAVFPYLWPVIFIFLLVETTRLFARAEKNHKQNFMLQNGESFTTSECRGSMHLELKIPLIENSETQELTRITFIMGDIWDIFSRAHLYLSGQTPKQISFDQPNGHVRFYTVLDPNWPPFRSFGDPSYTHQRNPYYDGISHIPTWKSPFIELQLGLNWIKLNQRGNWRSYTPATSLGRPEDPLKLHVELEAPANTSYHFEVHCQEPKREFTPTWIVALIFTTVGLIVVFIAWHLYRFPKGNAWTCFSLMGPYWTTEIQMCFFGGVPEDFQPKPINEEEQHVKDEGSVEDDDFFDHLILNSEKSKSTF